MPLPCRRTDGTGLKIARFSSLACPGRQGQLCHARCEACHIRWPALALSVMQLATLARGWINGNAADGILVVQVRHLGAIFREIFQLASREAFVTSGAGIFRPADNLLAIGHPAADGVAALPTPIGR